MHMVPVLAVLMRRSMRFVGMKNRTKDKFLMILLVFV